MSENQLVLLSKAFAVDIINTCDIIKERKRASAIISQLLRSGTSIGANIHEANYASSMMLGRKLIGINHLVQLRKIMAV